MNSKNGNKVFACFVDLRKSFDTVWLNGLFLKLQKAGLSGKIYNVVISMYSNAHSRVKCENIMSHATDVTKAVQCVHQWNVLSILLCNIFINGIGDDFAIGQSKLEIVSEFKYIGVNITSNITSNGGFLKAEKNLKASSYDMKVVTQE